MRAGAVPRIACQQRSIDHRAEGGVLRVVADGDDDVAFLAAKHLVGNHVRVRITHALRNLAGQKVVDRLVGVNRDDAVQKGHVDVLAFTAHMPVFEGREDGGGRVHASQQVADREAAFHGRRAGLAVRNAGDAHQAAHALEDIVISGKRRVGTVLAEAGDRAVHQARVDLAQVVIRESPACQRAHLVILDQNIGVTRKPPNDLLAFGTGEIDGDGLLAAVGAQEVGGGVASLAARGVFQERRAPSTRVIAHTGSLDLDHFGAQVGEVLRGPGPGENSAQVEYLDVPQRGRDGVALQK